MGTLPSHYLDELRAVDGAANLSTDEAASGYDATHFSISGDGVDTFTVLAGSFRALQHGCAELLYTLGYRFIGPAAPWIKRPNALNYSINVASKEWWMSSGVKFARNYDSNWGGVYSSEYTAFRAAFVKWMWLNGCVHSEGSQYPAPAGHRWSSFWTSEPTKSFFDANPQYLYEKSPGKFVLNLSGSLTTGEYNTLVELIAARLIYDGFTTDTSGTWNRTTFDPQDSDSWPSTAVFGFSKRVVDKVRAGTSAVHTFPAYAGVTNAQLGLLAYAGHRKPPPPGDYSGLYTGVTLQFGTAGYPSYPALVDAHKGRYDFMSIRDYPDDAVITTCRPLKNAQMRSTYLSRYDSYHASGVRAVDGQWSANWGHNCIATHAILNKCRTGSATAYADTKAAIVADIFGGDSAVASLFSILEDPLRKMHIWTLDDIHPVIDAMADSWYKTMFKRLFVIWYEIETLPDKQNAVDNPTTFKTSNDPYWVKFPKLMSHVWAMRNDNAIDSYSVVRRLANQAPNPEYPELRWGYTGGFWGAGERPPWWSNPQYSTEQDYTDAKAAIAAAAQREDDFDSQDLVVMNGVTPAISATDATGFRIIGIGELVFFGPGIVYQTGSVADLDDDGDPTGTYTDISVPYDFPAGEWKIEQEAGDLVYTHTGGKLYAIGFPVIRLDPHPAGAVTKRWIYAPGRIAGAINVKGSMRIDDGVRTFQISGSDTPADDPSEIRPGQLAVDNNNSRNYEYLSNIGPHISLKGSEAYVPRAFLEEDFPAFSCVNKV